MNIPHPSKLMYNGVDFMIECPYCQHEIYNDVSICPSCKHEIYVTENEYDPANETETFGELSIIEIIENKFKCSKCNHEECKAKEVAMSGTGLSKLFDIEHNHYLFVSCLNCGFVEVYDPDVLNGHKTGQLGTILDILFGG
jgi:predicted nucleic-acid-binding Zn-ribbon protein